MRHIILVTVCTYLSLCNIEAGSLSSSTPPINNYTVTENGITCVVMTTGLSFTLPYMGDTKNLSTSMPVPKDPFVNGTCDVSRNILNLYFNDTWSVSFIFVNTSATSYQLDSIILNYNLDKTWFPNISSTLVGTKYSILTKLANDSLAASVSGSYKCQGQTDQALNETAILSFYDLQYRAFGKTNSALFSDKDVQTCAVSSPEVDVDAAVAVSVGIALAVMLVLVLFLYFSFTKAKGHKYGYD